MHKLVPKLADLAPTAVAEALVYRRVGAVAGADVRYVLERGAAPDPSLLIDDAIAVHVATELGDSGSDACIFDGKVVEARLSFWPPDRAELHVVAIEGPLAAEPERQHDGAWLGFEAGESLEDVATALLERAGFESPAFESAIADSVPGQLVCAGGNPWEFLADVLRVHGAALAFRARDGGGVALALVREAKDAACLGQTRSLTVAPQAGSGYASEVGVVHRAVPAAAGVCWWDAAKETAGVAGATDRVGVGSPVCTKDVAVAIEPWAAVRDAAGQHTATAVTSDLRVSIGDKLELSTNADGDRFGWLDSALSDLYVVAVTARYAAVGAALAEAHVELVPGDASATPWSRRGMSARGWQLVAGEVVEMPPEQTTMKVRLDVDDPSGSPVEITCEWLTPCFSGEAGGLHMPPVPGDRVRLLVEPVPYGRVVHLGAVPGDERLTVLREAIDGTHELVRPAETGGGGGDSVKLVGDHLARVIAASPDNMTAWVSPKAGLGEGDDDSAGRWSIVAGGPGQVGEATRAALCLRDAQGSDTQVELRSEGNVHVEAATNAGAVVTETLEVKTKETLLHAEDGFTSESGAAIDLKCADVTIECDGSAKVSGSDVELDGSNTTISGSSETSISGGTVKIN